MSDKPTVLTFLSERQPYDMISVAGLAAILDRSEETIRRNVAAGRLPPPIRLDQQDWFMVAHLRRFFLRRHREVEAEALALATQQADELAALERKIRRLPGGR